MNNIAIDFSVNFFGGSGHYLSNLSGLGSLVSILLSNLVIIAGLVFVVLVIIGGIQMISSAGKSPQEFARGREIIYAALIGFIIVFAAYWIVRIIETATGVNIFG